MKNTISHTSNEMQERSFIEKYINVIGIILLLIGIILWIYGYDLMEANEQSTLGKVLEGIGEFFTLIVSLHFFQELFTKKAERKILQDELNYIVQPQKKVLDFLNQNILDLDAHTKTVFNLVRYTDTEFFEVRWKDIARKYTNIYILGDFHIRFLNLIKSELENEKKNTGYLFVRRTERFY